MIDGSSIWFSHVNRGYEHGFDPQIEVIPANVSFISGQLSFT